MRCFALRHREYPGVVVYRNAESAGAAKARLADTLQDICGMTAAEAFKGVNCVRAPEYDGLRLEGQDRDWAERCRLERDAAAPEVTP